MLKVNKFWKKSTRILKVNLGIRRGTTLKITHIKKLKNIVKKINLRNSSSIRISHKLDTKPK